MSTLRQLFYSDLGNQVIRTAIAPIKRFVPERFHFPVAGRIRIPISGNHPLRLQVNPTCYIGKVLFWEGLEGFESGVHNIFRFLIRRADTFLDVGANIGFYSMMASRYNPEVNVLAFEPLPAAFKFTEQNIALNKAENVRVFQLAVSDQTDTTTFFFSLNPKFLFVDDQLTSTGSLDQAQASRTDLLKKISVERTTLDHFLSTQQTNRIDLIKLDTEATEHLVIDGARHTLQKYRPIILCEVLPGKVEIEIQSRIESLDYVPYQITKSGLVEVRNLAHDRTNTNDHLFCPREKTGMVQELIRHSE